MLNDLAVKKLRADTLTEDEHNNNESNEKHSSFGSNESINRDLKRRDSLFDSRENLAGSRYSDDDCVPPTLPEKRAVFERIDARPLQDNVQLSNDLGKLGDEPVSLPALDVASDRISFRHNDPVYHSINVPNFTSKVISLCSVHRSGTRMQVVEINTANFAFQTSAEDEFSQSRTSPAPLGESKKGGLLKWKGVVLDAESANSSVASDENSDTEVRSARIFVPRV